MEAVFMTVTRIFNLAATTLGLFAIWPLVMILALLVRIKLGSPILFRQQRPGLHGRPFMMYKFRTMTDERDADGNLLPDVNRLTPFGKFLRSSSLDELPELINVLKGDMSLVGPRPLLMEYLPLYSPEQARRHELRPGITGWAQVNGRNAISWEEKFRLDVWYVDHQSFFLDLKILYMTFAKVFKREGISQEGQATMEAFRGSQSELHGERHGD
jgi:sugar transferase EpsL